MGRGAGKVRLEATTRLLGQADEALGNIFRQADEHTRLGMAEIVTAEARQAAREFEEGMDAVTRAASTTPAEVADRWQRVLDRNRKSV